MTLLVVGKREEWLRAYRNLFSETEWEISFSDPEELKSDELKPGESRQKKPTGSADRDLVIVDLSSLDSPAPEFIQQLKEAEWTDKILGLHIYSNARLVKSLMEAGLDGYVHIASSSRVILKAVRSVSRGEKVVLLDG